MSIISLLIALLLPSLSKTQTVARRIKCLANHRSMYSATAQYCTDYNGVLPDQSRNKESTDSHNIFDLGYTHRDYINNNYVAPTTYRRFFGLGTLVSYGYYASATMLRDPEGSYDPANSINAGNNVHVLSDAVVESTMATARATPSLATTLSCAYVMPTSHYLIKGASTPGNTQTIDIHRLGDKGRIIGTATEGYTPKPCSVIVQCDSGGYDPNPTAGKPTYTDGTHNKEGANTVYYDGHAVWVGFPDNILTNWSTGGGGRFYGNRDTRAVGGWSIAYASSLFQ